MVTYCWAVGLPGPTFTLPNDSELGLTVARGWTHVPNAPTVAAAMFKVPVPEFVTTTDWLADLVPTTWFPKARLEADRDTAGWTPLPLTATVCGEFDASSLKVRVPVNVPRLAGAKPICTVHVAPAESVAPEHESAITLNDEPPVSVAVET